MSALVVLDIETTGLVDFKRPLSDPAQPRLVQLGAVLFDGKGQEAACICLLVRPDGWVSSGGAKAVHGIAEQRCERYGGRARAALAVFMDMVRVADEIASYGLHFDRTVIDIELDRMGGSPVEWLRPGLRRTCVLDEAAQAANGGRSMKLPAAHLAIVGSEYQPTHNGLDDARAAARILLTLRQRSAS